MKQPFHEHEMSVFGNMRDFHGKLIIIKQILWHGTCQQRHSLTYTRANPKKNKLLTKNFAQNL